MKDPITTPGKTYAVTSPNGCTVTTVDGKPILTVQAGVQDYFVAPSGKVIVSDDAASVTENFRGMHTVALAAEAGANAAMLRAETAADSAQENAAKAEANAALLGDAALRSGDNVFTGNNVFNSCVQFAGGANFGAGVPWIGMMAMALGVPLDAAYAETEAEYWERSGLDKNTDYELTTIFAPLVPKIGLDFLLNIAGKGKVYMIAANVGHLTLTTDLTALFFHDSNLLVLNCYQLKRLRMVYTGTRAQFINWGHNAFATLPDLFIDAPNKVSGSLISGLNSIGRLRLRMPVYRASFTLKIGAMQKEDVLYLLQHLPVLAAGESYTAAISCAPELEADEDFLTQVAAFYDAETKTGWNVMLTFQANAKDVPAATAASTYSMRRGVNPVFASRERCEYGDYMDAAGQRWLVLSGTWVGGENRGFDVFPSLESALEEWGLTACPMDEPLTETE